MIIIGSVMQKKKTKIFKEDQRKQPPQRSIVRKLFVNKDIYSKSRQSSRYDDRFFLSNNRAINKIKSTAERICK